MNDLSNLQSAVSKLDVPLHKTNIAKGSNVIWLLQNLKVRNAQRPEFSTVMKALLDHATSQKLMKASELAEISKTLS